MNIPNTQQILSQNSININSLICNISFRKVSGNFFENDLYPLNEQRTTSGNSVFLNPDRYPGFAYSNSNIYNTGISYSLFSLRKVSPYYTGFAITAFRKDNSTSQNIGFDLNGNLDESALLNFCSPNKDCFVQTWYDQGPHNHNVFQNTGSLMPMIVSGGNLLKINNRPTIKFSGNYLISSSGISNRNIRSIFAVESHENYGSFSPSRGYRSGGRIFSKRKHDLFLVSSSEQPGSNCYKVQNGDLSRSIQRSNENSANIFNKLNLIDIDIPNTVGSTVPTTIYISGQFSSTGNNEGSRSLSPLTNSTYPFVIGNSLEDTALSEGRYFEGNISELIVFNNDQRFSREILRKNIMNYYNISNFSTYLGDESYFGSFNMAHSLKVGGYFSNNYSLLLEIDNLCSDRSSFVPSGLGQIFFYGLNTGSLNEKYQILYGITPFNNLFIDFSGNKNGIEEYGAINMSIPINQRGFVSLYIGQYYSDITYHQLNSGQGKYQTSRLYYNNVYSGKNNSEFFIGGLPFNFSNNLVTTSTGRYYTGFYGYIYDMGLFSGYISDRVMNDIVYQYFKTGERISNNVTQQIFYNTYSGAYLNPTGLLGYQITGYNYTPIISNLNLIQDNPYYLLSGQAISGAITGYKVEYASVTSSGITFQNEIIKENLYKNTFNVYNINCNNYTNNVTINNNDIIYDNEEYRFGVN